MIFIKIFTAFPDLFSDLSKFSKNIKKFCDSFIIQDLRNYGKIDIETSGTNRGMVFKIDTLSKALMANSKHNSEKILILSPEGQKLNQQILFELSELDFLSIFLFRYEGVDARFLNDIDYNISIGDFIVSNGEIASLVFLDALFRLCGTVKKHSINDSFSNQRLDYDVYGLPRLDHKKRSIPKLLLEGNHKKIDLWKKHNMLLKTFFYRTDLITDLDSDEEKMILEFIKYGLELLKKLNKNFDNKFIEYLKKFIENTKI